MIDGRRPIIGWPGGTSIDSQDTLSFSLQSDVRSINQVFPLEQAPEAFELVMSGKARFRCVLTTGNWCVTMCVVVLMNINSSSN
jgi:D-arabinose 1-dehydrogenase-like Zn-dependent alcohol dehydrogenase